MKKIMLIIIMLMLASMVTAEKQKLFQNYPLTDELIIQALEEGAKRKGKEVGLKLTDQVSSFMGLLDSRSHIETTGFSIHVQTPYTWIAQQASWSAKKYQEMTEEQVTDAMKEPVMMIICNPDIPKKRDIQMDRRGVSGVEHVVIRSTEKKDFSIIQPISTELGSELTQNIFGAQIEYESLIGYFAMGEVMQISALDKKGEFFVLIIGTTGEEKKFKVKTKHFKKLP